MFTVKHFNGYHKRICKSGLTDEQAEAEVKRLVEWHNSTFDEGDGRRVHWNNAKSCSIRTMTSEAGEVIDEFFAEME